MKMYKEDILDLYRNPLNEGEIEEALFSEGSNPQCGDEMKVYVETGEGEVKRIRHRTSGCAISTASISLLSEELVGMDPEDVAELDSDFVIDLLGVEISPMRMKCALLGLETVQRALKDH